MAAMADRNDMTTGSEWKRIMLFALPIMLGQFLQQLYNTVDGIVVGNFGGPTKEICNACLAAVGGCGSLAMVFLAVCFGMGSGCAVLISQLYGARREAELRRAGSTVLIIMSALGVVFSVLGYFLARPILRDVMNVQDPYVLELATEYFAIYCIGLVFQYSYNAVAFILRAVGDSRATLYFLCISSVLNLGLDLLFVISFGWGVMGVAVATVVSQAVCLVFSIFYMRRKYPIFRYGRGELTFDGELAGVCVKLGVPTTLQHCIISFGGMFMQRLVNGFGTDLMSAYTVGIRIENYIFVPIMAINNGVATFTGQNIGAEKPERVRRGFWASLITSLLATVLMSALVYFFAAPVSGLFGVEGKALDMAVEMLHFMALVFIIFSSYLPATGLLTGAGDVFFVSLCSLLSLVVRVALSYVMVLGMGADYPVVWYVVPVGWGMAVLMAYIRFFSGKWKTKAVVHARLEPEAEDIKPEESL